MEFSMYKAIISLVIACALSACVSPSQWMVAPNGQKVRCASAGFGYIGAPLAEHMFHTCVADYQKIGYVPLVEKE
jgi:hypothetical protein